MRHKTISIYVDPHLKKLLRQEDLDRDLKITKEDKGPKKFCLSTLTGDEIEVEGHYPLSNLLQLLAHAHQDKKKICKLELSELYQSPVDQINKQINTYYWGALTRTFDEKGIVELLEDPKREKGESSILYVPEKDKEAYEYFNQIAAAHRYLKLKVCHLPKKLDPAYLSKINKNPGLLSLSINASPELGNPFVVPGGRFNEMYGWDSYFIIEGLLLSNKCDLALSMLKHLVYQIKYYGKILNANRTYYLLRSQPPFLTSIIRLILNFSSHHDWLKDVLDAAITEYKNVWMSSERLTSTGLSRYFGEGEKEPLEVEENHFDVIYRPFAQKANLTVCEYRKKYLSNEIKEPKLDKFFVHDRSMRESGHDTSYRLLNLSADLVTVDLNSLLYKYEKDISFIISKYFNGRFIDQYGDAHLPQDWDLKAKKRKELVQKYLWCDEKKMFLDYDTKKQSNHLYESATTFYPLFSGLATSDQAESLIKSSLPLFESSGGLLCTTESSRGSITENRPLRQWDFPFGWAPHQMLFWKGAASYGYVHTSQRLAYKWLYMITKEARDYNGTISEKYDVDMMSHKLTAEYGNVGNDFGLYPNGGFGWVNSSYLLGQKILSDEQLNALKDLQEPDLVFE